MQTVDAMPCHAMPCQAENESDLCRVTEMKMYIIIHKNRTTKLQICVRKFNLKSEYGSFPYHDTRLLVKPTLNDIIFTTAKSAKFAHHITGFYTNINFHCIIKIQIVLKLNCIYCLV